MKRVQQQRIKELFAACCQSGHELLLELILPQEMASSDGDTVRAMREIYDLGVYPDWWKLSPPDGAEWDALEALLDECDPWCHGVVLLGLNRPTAELVSGFGNAVGRKYCKGFAIGRSIFSAPALQWLAGAMDDEALCSAVAANFANMVVQWRAVHGENPPGAARQARKKVTV